MSIKSVLAFGDSHVTGCETLGSSLTRDYLNGKIELEEMDNATKDNAFPSFLASMLGVPCYNYALSGSSNKRSKRMLYNALQEHSNSLVLFCYTEPDWTEFKFDKQGQWLGYDSTGYIQAGPQWKTVNNHKRVHPFNDYYMTHMHTSESYIDQDLFYVDAVCKQHAVYHLHIFLWPDIYKGEVHSDNILKLKAGAGTNNGYGSFKDWAEARLLQKHRRGHFNIEGQKLFAKFIRNQLPF